MKTIAAKKIQQAVSGLAIKANLILREDVLAVLKDAHSKESDKRAKNILKAILDNADIAKKEKLAICQDTGMPCVFIEMGSSVKISGDLKKAVNSGIAQGYKQAYLRNSVVKDPLKRGQPGYAPAIIHMDIVNGNKLKITVLPKGFGCENKAQLKMFKPTAAIPEIKKFIIETVKNSGPDACPPYIVGVGIGGAADYACLLAKKALLRELSAKRPSSYGKLELELLKGINRLNIGPMGLGGKTSCLAVNIESYPTHIAGLPVCVNISCHALRSASACL